MPEARLQHDPDRRMDPRSSVPGIYDCGSYGQAAWHVSDGPMGVRIDRECPRLGKQDAANSDGAFQRAR